MIYCAYCGKRCDPTREHLIPKWYIKKNGNLETFNARSPISQIKGELTIKDVCSSCNNVLLGDLDSYGKSLYEIYFCKLVYSGESVVFQYQYDLLVRWLLKLSYNSARAHNSDLEILKQFNPQILGQSGLSDQLCIFSHLIAPTFYASDVRPAERSEANHDEIYEPRWFRVAQMRMPAVPRSQLVQRLVMINSFAFTIFAVSRDSSFQDSINNSVLESFANACPHARRLTTNNETVLKTGISHADESVSWLLSQYPIRFFDKENPLVKRIHSGEETQIFIMIPRELIVQQDIEPIVEVLKNMINLIQFGNWSFRAKASRLMVFPSTACTQC